MKSKNKKLLTVDFIVLVLPVFNGCYIKGCPVWKNEPIWFLLKVGGKIFSCITQTQYIFFFFFLRKRVSIEP